jgi:hypothetical protein
MKALAQCAPPAEGYNHLVRLLVLLLISAPAVFAAGPAYVDITWMSIANVYYEIGGQRILADGYITRIPQAEFFGGGGGLGQTRHPWKPDVEGVKRVLAAIGGPSKVQRLLTGHSHFDHSFDTATWSKLTNASIIGSQTTCFQAMAEKVPKGRCRAVFGGEKIKLGSGVTMYVVRWNHSGDPAVAPEQHNAVELDRVPVPDPVTGGLRGGVAEDFPNGGGNRAYLFTVDGPAGRYSWLFQDSASAVDMHVPIVIGGKNYGAPIDNLKAAMKDAGLESVDLWFATGGVQIAQLVVPIIKPKAVIPVHWEGLWGSFWVGVPRPYSDSPFEVYLTNAGIKLLKPQQYMDKWRLDRNGVTAVPNDAVKKKLGL